MKKQSFKKKIDILWNELNRVIATIQTNEKDLILRSESILMEADLSIGKLKELLLNHNFQDWAEEIFFFKITKPKFISIYIYYSKVLAIESSKPYGDASVLKRYYESERSNLLYFYRDQKEFISYYRRNANYLDKKYFIRYKFDFKQKLSPEIYSYDSHFTTSHDHLVSQLIANDLLDQYLSEKIETGLLQNNQDGNWSLEWTAPKVALIELLFALHQTKCFNAGQSDIAEIFRWAEVTLRINLGNYHKTLNEIKLRKSERTKFLSLIQHNMAQYLDNSDQ
ncbi:MAG: RteC domain-containing protein [Chryseobacterium culicis]